MSNIQVIMADIEADSTYVPYVLAQAIVQGMAERCLASFNEKCAGCYALELNGTLFLAVRLFPNGPDQVSQEDLMQAVKLQMVADFWPADIVEKNYRTGVDWKFLEELAERR